MGINLECRAKTLCDLAKEAGELAKKCRDLGLRVSSKGKQDFVTQADREIEALLSSRLLDIYPKDGVLGEENGLIEGLEGTWVIDPIDGTSNYIKGMDYWCVSLAYVQDNQTLIGCIYAPDRDEMFLAIRGQGCFLNGIKLSLEQDVHPSEAILGLGMSGRRPFSDYIKAVSKLIESGMEYRRFGSGALMLAHVAAGQLDGYYEAHLNSWDAAAGVLLVSEAGGLTNDFMANQGLTEGNVILAASSSLYSQLDALLLEHSVGQANKCTTF